MSFATARPATAHRPISEINTTPLIDVMLVLLIMLVITIPLATNAVEIDLPKGGAKTELTVNTIVITGNGQVLWNGAPVSERELSGILAQATLLDPEPQLRFEPEASAAYGQTARVLWLIEQSGVSNFGFAGNERYRNFGTGS